MSTSKNTSIDYTSQSVGLPSLISTKNGNPIGYAGSVTSGSDWLSFDGSSASVTENTTTDARSGSITLTQDESNKTLSWSITQDKKEEMQTIYISMSEHHDRKGCVSLSASSPVTIGVSLNFEIETYEDIIEEDSSITENRNQLQSSVTIDVGETYGESEYLWETSTNDNANPYYQWAVIRVDKPLWDGEIVDGVQYVFNG